MRKESSTVQKCKRQMATLGFDSQLAYHRVKLILKIYRDVVWVLSERVEELHEYDEYMESSFIGMMGAEDETGEEICTGMMM